jgi:energy-coupling factor transporter ATP-binding protein EcfA2
MEPFAIKRVSIRGLYGLFDRELSFADRNIHVLIGQNGYGKTTILRLLDMLFDSNREIDDDDEAKFLSSKRDLLFEPIFDSFEIELTDRNNHFGNLCITSFNEEANTGKGGDGKSNLRVKTISFSFYSGSEKNDKRNRTVNFEYFGWEKDDFGKPATPPSASRASKAYSDRILSECHEIQNFFLSFKDYCEDEASQNDRLTSTTTSKYLGAERLLNQNYNDLAASFVRDSLAKAFVLSDRIDEICDSLRTTRGGLQASQSFNEAYLSIGLPSHDYGFYSSKYWQDNLRVESLLVQTLLGQGVHYVAQLLPLLDFGVSEHFFHPLYNPSKFIVKCLSSDEWQRCFNDLTSFEGLVNKCKAVAHGPRVFKYEIDKKLLEKEAKTNEMAALFLTICQRSYFVERPHENLNNHGIDPHYYKDFIESINLLALYQRLKTIFEDALEQSLPIDSRYALHFDFQGSGEFRLSNEANPKMVISLDQLSSGQLNAFLIFYSVLMGARESSYLFIDEPEVSMHLLWQEEVIGILESIAKDYNIQIIVSTQSPFILNNRNDLLVEAK